MEKFDSNGQRGSSLRSSNLGALTKRLDSRRFATRLARLAASPSGTSDSVNDIEQYRSTVNAYL